MGCSSVPSIVALQDENWTWAGQILDLRQARAVSAPHNGRVKDYAQYCPVALASSVIAERWTPLIIRELVIGGRRFNEIDRGLPGISRSLLKQRLDHLERKGVVERVELAQARPRVPPDARRSRPRGRHHGGRRVGGALDVQRAGAARGRPGDADLVDVAPGRRPRRSRRTGPSCEFDYPGEDPTRIWIVLERGETSVCTDPPGFDIDVVVTTEPVDLMRVFSGITTYPEALERAPSPRWRPAASDPGAAALVRLEPLRPGRPRASGRRDTVTSPGGRGRRPCLEQAPPDCRRSRSRISSPLVTPCVQAVGEPISLLEGTRAVGCGRFAADR